MNQQQQPRTLPSFSGLSSAVNEARDYEKSRSSGAAQQEVNPSGNNAAVSRRRHVSPTSETAANALDGGRTASASAGVPSKTDASGNFLVQDTLTPLLDEVDALFERSKEIAADFAAQGKQHDEDVRASVIGANMCLHTLGSAGELLRALAEHIHHTSEGQGIVSLPLCRCSC